MTRAAWWLCPLNSCPHGAVLHDGDGYDEPLRCCVEDCDCGATDGMLPVTKPDRVGYDAPPVGGAA